MTPGDRPSPEHERFAAEWLGLEVGAGLTPLLRRLDFEDFLPDPVTHDAIRILSGRPFGESRLAERAAEDEESRLHEEVERFAADFFATPPAERRARWASLEASCQAHPGLAARLRDLARGLDVDPSTAGQGSPLAARLARLACELFVLAPDDRAVARRRLVRDVRGDATVAHVELSRALSELKQNDGAVAALAPEFLDRLAQPRNPKAPRPPRQVLRQKLNRPEPSQLEGNRRFVVGALPFIVVSLMMLSRTLATIPGRRPEPDLSRPAASPSLPGSTFVDSQETAHVVAPGMEAPPAFLRLIRDQFKVPIRDELGRLGKNIDDRLLRRVVDGLPAEDVPAFDPSFNVTEMLDVLGYWSDPVLARYDAALKRQLMLVGVILTDAEYAQVARCCWPYPGKNRRAKVTPAYVIEFRNLFRVRIYDELNKLGKKIDEEALQRVVEGLPVEEIPEFYRGHAGMQTLGMFGYWTDAVRARYDAALKRQLMLVGVVLTDADYARVAGRCWPSPSKSPKPKAGAPGAGSP